VKENEKKTHAAYVWSAIYVFVDWLIIKMSRDITFDKRSRGSDIGDYEAAVM